MTREGIGRPARQWIRPGPFQRPTMHRSQYMPGDNTQAILRRRISLPGRLKTKKNERIDIPHARSFDRSVRNNRTSIEMSAGGSREAVGGSRCSREYKPPRQNRKLGGMDDGGMEIFQIDSTFLITYSPALRVRSPRLARINYCRVASSGSVFIK